MNTGGFDPMDRIAEVLAGHPNHWVHVDGAFGLWANVSPQLRLLVRGVERADSWSTDAHKWLNAGYDCGFVAVRDPRRTGPPWRRRRLPAAQRPAGVVGVRL